MGNVSAGQESLVHIKHVFADVATAIKRGYTFCYSRGRLTDERGTTVAASAVNSGRYRVVVKPTLANIEDFAGWAAGDYVAKADGQWIDIFVPVEGACVPVYAKASCTINSTVLGPVPGQHHMAGGAVFSAWAVKACQTVNRATTAGEVQAVVVRSTAKEALASISGYSTHMTELPSSSTTDLAATFLLGTIAHAGAIAKLVTESDGVAVITNAGADNDGTQYELCSAITLAATKAAYVKGRLKLNDATDSDLAFGLAITDSAIIGSVPNGAILFTKDDDDAIIDYVVKNGSGNTTVTAIGTMDTSYHTYEIVWDGAALTLYIDGTLVATPAVTYAPTGLLLRLVVELLNGAAAAKTVSIDELVVKGAAA